MAFRVLVDDNFRYMDESGRYVKGDYDSYADALASCMSIVDEYLAANHQVGMQADALFGSYVAFGENPFIVPDSADAKFSAWDYAKVRCAVMCDAI